VLQTGTFERVGGNRPAERGRPRLIAATNKPLEAAVAAEAISGEDLFYRPDVVRIHLLAACGTGRD
jgi:transcriptional regulator with GAF, ATPase, and Fis domain